MKAWLKGGLIAVVVFVIFFVIFFVAGEDAALIIMLVFFFGENPLNPFVVVGYFVIGALIGWGIQKLRR